MLLQSTLIVRSNRINRNAECALFIVGVGQVVVEDNDLTGNGEGAWQIHETDEPNVTRARNKE